MDEFILEYGTLNFAKKFTIFEMHGILKMFLKYEKFKVEPYAVGDLMLEYSFYCEDNQVDFKETFLSTLENLDKNDKNLLKECMIKFGVGGDVIIYDMIMNDFIFGVKKC